MIRILFTICYLITMLAQGLFVEQELGWWLFQLGVLGVIHLVWGVLIIKRKFKRMKEERKEYGKKLLDDCKTHVFVCEYYNHTDRIKGKCEIKARNMEEATTHFRFLYPNKLLWKVSVKHGT